MKKRNFFANKENSSFLNLVKVITENIDDETEGLDFDDEADDMGEDTTGEDDFGAEDDMGDDEFADEAGDEVTLTLPRDVAQTLYDMLGEMLGGEDMGEDDFGAEDDMGDDEFADEAGDDFGAEDDVEDEMFPEDEEDAEEEDAEEEEAECEDKKKMSEEDEEVLGSDMSNVAQSTISRQGAPKRSKANTSWNTGKTVKSVFDQTVSHEGEPAGVNRDGAPKRSKFSKEPNRSKTVSSRFQPGKHAFEIGK